MTQTMIILNDDSGILVKYMLILLFIKHKWLFIAYEYTTLATRQSDVVVEKTNKEQQCLSPPPCLKFTWKLCNQNDLRVSQ